MWFKLDDGFWTHRKTRRAARRCPQSLGLWVVTASACAEASTDGVIPEDMLEDCVAAAGLTSGMGTKATAALTASGLWHDHRSIRDCPPCLAAVSGRLQRGAHYAHDWLEYQFTRDEAKVPEVRWKKARAKALHRNLPLKAAIVERDRDRCRYCAVRVDFRDRVGPTGGTYDHVDPSIRENTLENVVVACRHCNEVLKGERTPDEAGMTLLDPPSPDLPPARTGPEPDQAPVGAGSSHTGAPRATRDGPGREQAPARSRPGVAEGERPADVPSRTVDA